MRKVLLICLCSVLFFTSCATTSVMGEKKNQKEELFNDWEYKGFGNVLPAWVEPYFNGGVDAVRAACPEYSGNEIKIISEAGQDADQAEQLLDESITDDNTKGYTRSDSVWVHLLRKEDIAQYNGKTYVSMRLYIK
jgi:hypothetical protein